MQDAYLARAALEVHAHYNFGVEAGREIAAEEDFVLTEPGASTRCHRPPAATDQ